jgi:hypothetical protein
VITFINLPLTPTTAGGWNSPNEVTVDFDKVVTDTGEVVREPGRSNYPLHSLNFRTMPANTHSLTVTLVQTRRYVEFLVKPQ